VTSVPLSCNYDLPQICPRYGIPAYILKNELADMQSTIDLRIVEHFAEQKEKALALLVKELTTKKS